ncbi:MAG TPA: aminotransferase class V-fold PLP-dependent enzyme [Kofleriaceae bacterium]|nr:aminotransferase class V-fold PLP-dependent enzyme [Kofleriaceae bacterium]
MTHELSSPDTQLELDGAALRALVDEVVDRLATYLDSVGQQPASAPIDEMAPIARALAGAAMPETGQPVHAVLDTIFERVLPATYHTDSPGFFGYFAGGGIPQAAVADLIAGVVNRFVGRWAAAPAAVQLEVNVLRWLADLVGYPATARGVLTSGGSQANLTAVFAARQQRIGYELAHARLYASEHVHFSIVKSAAICGIPETAVRRVPVDADGRMNIAALVQQIRADRRDGGRPFLVVASAGTFLTGAIDDLPAVAAVARDEDLWFHVDAAYGGFFLLTERGLEQLAGIAGADSVTLDPHKGLFLPYGTGALLVRAGDVLKRVHQIDADFYGPLLDDGHAIDFCSYSIEQTRPFRGLRVWLPLALHGVAPFRRNLDEKLDLAGFACGELRAIPGVELVAAGLTVIAFRLLPATGDPARRDAAQRALVQRVNARGNVFVMTAELGGGVAVRMCILSFRAHLDRVRMAIADIRAAAAEVLAHGA